MTTEQIYKSLLSYIKTLEQDDQDFINKTIERESQILSAVGAVQLSNIMIELKRDIRANTAKASGKANAYKSALDIIKAAPDSRPTFKGAIVQDNKQYVCDGYRAIRFNKPIELPISPQQDQAPKMETFFQGIATTDELTLPSIADLKMHIKMKAAEYTGKSKSKPDIYWDIENSDIRVNAKYLLTILEAIPNAKGYAGKTSTSVLYFTSPDNNDVDAILCPMRKKEAA